MLTTNSNLGRSCAAAIPSRSAVDVVQRIPPRGSLEASRTALTAPIHLLHLEPIVLFHCRLLLFLLLLRLDLLRPAFITKTPIAWLVVALELHVRRWTRSDNDGCPILQDGVLAERSVSILLLELMTVEVFSRRLASPHEEEVVYPQTRRIGDDDDAVDEHGKRDTPHVDSMPKAGVIADHPDQDMGKAGSQQETSQGRAGSDKGQKVAVITTTNAVVEPDAVVVLRFDTRVTYATMVCSWRSPDVARLAVLDRHFHCRRGAIH